MCQIVKIKFVWRLLFLMGIVVFLVSSQSGKNLVHKLDSELFHERILDAYGRWVKEEDWGKAIPLARKPDYDWLKLAVGLPYFLVAHALGHEPNPNTVEALTNSIKLGFQFVEVDLWLDQAGHLRCHHGPELPEPYKQGDCTFTTLLGYVERNGIWLILDIKSDFVTTGNRVLNELRNNEAARHVVFQLYLPEHFSVFNSWAALEPLPGPIATAYLSHRSLGHIVSNLERLGVRAFTFPLERYNALPTQRPEGLTLFTHPVHDCEAVRKAMIGGIRGIYSNSTLSCN